jgi:hypothetical protein
MLCPNCTKLATIYTNKKCIRCQGAVFVNISAICDFCSSTESQCSACLKKIVTPAQRAAIGGCNCGRK